VFLLSSDIAGPGEDLLSGTDSVYFDLVTPVPPASQFAGGPLPAEASAPPPVMMKYQVRTATAAEARQASTQVVPAAGWSRENTLDLGDFEINRFARAARIKMLVASILFFGTLGFFAYVAAMNEWAIDVNHFDEQVKRAFFLQTPVEKEADLLVKLDVRLLKGYHLRLKKGLLVGVITGEVQNNAAVGMQHVMLEGRLLNPSRQVILRKEVPCDVSPTDAQIRTTRRNQVSALYESEGAMHNCVIRSGYTVNFKVVFEELPKEFNSNWVFQVGPASAAPVPAP